MRNACLAFALFLVTGCDGARPFPDYGPSPDDLAVRDLAARDLQSPCGPCENPTPKCEIVSKKCVACLADADCPDAFVCAKGACMPGCSKSHLQCGDAGSCDLDAGICHGCLSDKDCADPKSPACDVPSGRCGACSTQNDRCPAGSYCVLSGGAPACVPGCKTDVECQFRDGGVGSSACCDHACVNTATSLTHCGACGAACNKTDCCAGRCVDAQSDLMNCGGCGKACPAKNNVPTCAGGTCGTGGCVMGFADCDGSAANGCETATSSDKNNCGACGKVCNIPNASALCSVGSCVVQSCNAGFRDCNGDPADGCEINLQMDPMNCGVCGQSCAALPHASAGCKNGACNIGACDAGWGDCDGMAGNGCESKVDADPANCGGCGKACPMPPNVIVTCANNTCMTGGCQPGFTDCNNNPADGCEANTRIDTKNCGACGNTCPAYANAVAACAGGMCGLGACNAGYGDCDGNPANGCELSLLSDPNNCGRCGNVCGAPGMCMAGTCIAGPACSNGSYTDCNVPGTTLIQGSAFVDKTPPNGWVQCAGFINTAGDDVTATFLNNCLNTTRLRIRVFTGAGALEEDISVPNQTSWNAWPNFNYLGGTVTVTMKTFWGATNFFTCTDGRDACAQQAAPSGITFGTGNGSVAIVVGGNTAYNEYRVSCGGMNLPDRKIALYR